MNLSQALIRFRSNNQASDQEKYVLILRKKELSAQDVEDLKTLLVRLGKTTDHAQSDAELIARAAELQTHINAGCRCDKTGRQIGELKKEAWDTFVAHNQETKRLQEERSRGVEPLRSEYGRLQDLQNRAQEAVGELNTLRDRHPELLPHVAKAKME